MKVQKLNEWYKFPENYDIFNPPTQTYVDKVFDCLLYIILHEKGISEKAFKDIDNTKNYLESFFDNNKEIFPIMDAFNSEKSRPNFCAEHLYHEFFKNSNNELE